MLRFNKISIKYNFSMFMDFDKIFIFVFASSLLSYVDILLYHFDE